MFNFFASLFGYLLKLLYNLVNNYGLAIILFTVAMKVILLPLSIKQQKTMKKSTKLQEKMKILQFKYKNDPEKLNQEVMNLYRNEKVNPLSGCFTAILQMIMLLSIFYLVRSPLTFMQKVPTEDLNRYVQQLQDEGKGINQAYPEIGLIKDYNWLKEKNPDDANVDKLNMQMNFCGLDLNKVPNQNLNDKTVYIIPVLYILTTVISMRMTTAMQEKQQKASKEQVIDGETGKELAPKEENNDMDAVMQANKMMSWMMPIMSVSIALVAPLGLALYWLVSNILMIAERLVLDKYIKD